MCTGGDPEQQVEGVVLARGELPGDGHERVEESLARGCQLGVARLVDVRAEPDVEQGRLVRSEPDVRGGEGGELRYARTCRRHC